MREPERFWGDQAPLLRLSCLLLGVLILIWSQINYLLYADFRPSPAVFAANADGSLIQEVPLDSPNQSENILLNWVTDVLMNINTFNFVNLDASLQKARPYFTDEGYQNYQEALSNLKILDQVRSKKLILSAIPLDAPHVLIEKIFSGRYMWRIQIPMHFKYQSVAFVDSERYQITLVVMRVPIKESPLGIAILKYEVSPLTQDY